MLLYTQMYLQKLQEEDALYCGNSSLPVPRRVSTQDPTAQAVQIARLPCAV